MKKNVTKLSIKIIFSRVELIIMSNTPFKFEYIKVTQK